MIRALKISVAGKTPREDLRVSPSVLAENEAGTVLFRESGRCEISRQFGGRRGFRAYEENGNGILMECVEVLVDPNGSGRYVDVSEQPAAMKAMASQRPPRFGVACDDPKRNPSVVKRCAEAQAHGSGPHDGDVHVSPWVSEAGPVRSLFAVGL